jgi:hypothetical protein
MEYTKPNGGIEINLIASKSHFSQKIVTQALVAIKWVYMALLGFIRSRKLGERALKSKRDNFRNRINSMLFQDFKGEEMRKTRNYTIISGMLMPL